MSLVRVPLCVMLLGGSILSSARAGLDEYVKRPDPAYAWKAVGQEVTESGTVYSLELTSQVWQGITWRHTGSGSMSPTKVEASRVRGPAVHHRGEFLEPAPRPGGPRDGLRARPKLCGARVAVLPAGAQPAALGRQDGGHADRRDVRPLSWRRRTRTGRLLFPMVKSAVRAMDAVARLGQGANGQPAVSQVRGDRGLEAGVDDLADRGRRQTDRRDRADGDRHAQHEGPDTPTPR